MLELRVLHLPGELLDLGQLLLDFLFRLQDVDRAHLNEAVPLQNLLGRICEASGTAAPQGHRGEEDDPSTTDPWFHAWSNLFLWKLIGNFPAGDSLLSF